MAQGSESDEHNLASLEEKLASSNNVVLIVDRGLIFFGKFALALLALFTFIAIAFFGFDLQQARSKLQETTTAMTKNLRETETINANAKKIIKDTQKELQALESRLDKFEDRINFIATHLTLTVVDNFSVILQKTTKDSNAIRQLFKELLQISNDQNMIYARPYILSRLARFEDYEQANDLLNEAHESAITLGDRKMQANILKSRGELENTRGMSVAAIRSFEHALSVLNEMSESTEEDADINVIRGQISVLLAESFRNNKQYQKALEAMKQAYSSYGIDLPPKEEAQLVIRNANIYADMGKNEEVFQLYQEAEVIVENIENKEGFSSVYKRLAEMYRERDEENKAIQYLCRFARYSARQEETFRRAVRKWNRGDLTFEVECSGGEIQPGIGGWKDVGTGVEVRK